ncbi:MAG: ATP-binding protein, partial [Anaerolineae bacterium]|nr:ATP-binding protein [Anaerolineae bacterium]
HVAMLLGSGIYRAKDVVLGLDIGTNTEVALKVGDRLLTCSTASGPAFEGAHIKAGMRAGPGAIERVWIDGEQVALQIIDDQPPVGICGSGILDAVGQLRKIGVLNDLGGMSLDHPRARMGEAGPEFVLVPRTEQGDGSDIVLTRGDVSEIQLAKGAMRAGTEVLMQEAGIMVDDLDRIVIAGAFGSYIDVRNALRVGMFPSLPVDRFEQVGNAAGVGARLALISAEQRELANEIARQAEYVELTNDPRFTMAFTEAMMLPVL